MAKKKVETRYKLRERRVRNAVRMNWENEERTKLSAMADKLLSIWAGEKLWEEGYGPDLKEMELMEKMFDYNHKLGTAASITADDAMSIRRYCYQFAKLADRITDQYEGLKTEYEKLRNHPVYLILQLIREAKCWLTRIPEMYMDWRDGVRDYRQSKELDD